MGCSNTSIQEDDNVSNNNVINNPDDEKKYKDFDELGSKY